VNFPGSTKEIGRFNSVKITGALAHSLRGEIGEGVSGDNGLKDHRGIRG
jgi:hypothetical protein